MPSSATGSRTSRSRPWGPGHPRCPGASSCIATGSASCSSAIPTYLTRQESCLWIFSRRRVVLFCVLSQVYGLPRKSMVSASTSSSSSSSKTRWSIPRQRRRFRRTHQILCLWMTIK
ncbi:hypothetical protein ATCV1_z468R [Acanthocystis turfacea chlorella virus 1]|uniref:Uncharacterized protein z468R n=1 Tax=Chlorovirus heliozoae TaxID=322019 RepID=A7K978_9PHYC|nr:hypothetical protein ATCV1_z468R [Acanthocystis turfacea chlorella virus 1]ABT16602.1 hypothetical protein ATCV1_z468R [Acanthocystis turfacea chlorella virus 1]